MMRAVFLGATVIALCSCGRKGGGGDVQAGADVRRTDPVAFFNKEREKYQRNLAAVPEAFGEHRVLAEVLLQRARAIGESELISWCEQEIKAIDRRYRTRAQAIFDQAQGAALAKATAGLEAEELWDARWRIWDECVAQLEAWELKYRANREAIRDIVEEARNRRAQSYLLQKAYLRFTNHVREARSAAESRGDPESAVAQLAVFKAWLRSEGLVAEEAGEGSPEENGGEAERSGRELLAKVDAALAEYEGRLPPLEGAETEGEGPRGMEDVAKVPWEEIPADEFLITFGWNSDGGSCDTEEDRVVADGGDKGGLIEAADADWSEFMLELQVKLAAGERFWLGARPVVSASTGQPEYRRKLPVSLPDDEWHLLRVQVRDDSLSVFELLGESGAEAKALADPADLLPMTSRRIRGGFMIGLEPEVKIELREVKVKVLARGAAGGGEEAEGAEETPGEEAEGAEETPGEEAEGGEEEGGEEDGESGGDGSG